MTVGYEARGKILKPKILSFGGEASSLRQYLKHSNQFTSQAASFYGEGKLHSVRKYFGHRNQLDSNSQ